jgi:hypothetical protein
VRAIKEPTALTTDNEGTPMPCQSSKQIGQHAYIRKMYHRKTNNNNNNNETQTYIKHFEPTHSQKFVLPAPSQAHDERLSFHPIGTRPKDQEIFWVKSQPSALPRRSLVPVSKWSEAQKNMKN